jgi:hypothetical protein
MCCSSHTGCAGEAKTLASQLGSSVMFSATINAAQRAWPMTAIGLAVAINAVWIAALGYGVWSLF